MLEIAVDVGHFLITITDCLKIFGFGQIKCPSKLSMILELYTHVNYKFIIYIIVPFAIICVSLNNTLADQLEQDVIV